MRAVVVVVGGLPGAGKSTIAVELARRTATLYLRVDRIEQTIVDSTSLTHPLGPVGYGVAHQLAREQLELGLSVIVECVNPIAETRDAWPATAAAADAGILEVEVVCSDVDEHRRRVESRPTDVPGLRKPTWTEVLDRDYEPWSRDRLVIDTAHVGPEAAVEQIAVSMGTAAG